MKDIRLLIQEIDKCLECTYMRTERKSVYICDFTDEYRIPNPWSIPDWCPLEKVERKNARI